MFSFILLATYVVPLCGDQIRWNYGAARPIADQIMPMHASSGCVSTVNWLMAFAKGTRATAPLATNTQVFLTAFDSLDYDSVMKLHGHIGAFHHHDSGLLMGLGTPVVTGPFFLAPGPHNPAKFKTFFKDKLACCSTRLSVLFTLSMISSNLASYGLIAG